MVWALLALLGVPIWLVISGLVVALYWKAHQIKSKPNTFRLKMRKETGAFGEVGDRWPRFAAYALWVHDVLLVHRGVGLIQTTPIGIDSMLEIGQATEGEKLTGLGDSPVIVRFRLDDESVIQMAVTDDELMVAQGPFIGSKLAERST